MRWGSKEWFLDFFTLLESQKHNMSITMPEVFERFHSVHNRFEFSNSSKFVATIRPELPVFDSKIRKNLKLSNPSSKLPSVRFPQTVKVYGQLNDEMTKMLSNRLFTSDILPRFDSTFPDFAHFTPMKKLDLMLWQLRSKNTDRPSS
jgi:hypothetical protein